MTRQYEDETGYSLESLEDAFEDARDRRATVGEAILHAEQTYPSRIGTRWSPDAIHDLLEDLNYSVIGSGVEAGRRWVRLAEYPDVVVIDE